MKRIKLLLPFLLFLGCQQSAKEQDQEIESTAITNSPRNVVNDSASGAGQVLSVCQMASNVDQNISCLIESPDSVLKTIENDSCVLALIHAVSDKALKEKNARYFAALNSLCSVADGYVAEYFLEVGNIQFNQNLNGLLEYLGDHSANCIALSIANSFSIQISIEDNKKQVMAYLDSLVQFGDFKGKQRQIITKIKKEIDPSKYD